MEDVFILNTAVVVLAENQSKNILIKFQVGEYFQNYSICRNLADNNLRYFRFNIWGI